MCKWSDSVVVGTLSETRVVTIQTEGGIRANVGYF